MTDEEVRREQAAFEMLQFNPYSLPADFDWELAALGRYSQLQRERSDTALKQFEDDLEAALKPEKGPRTELEAFHWLNRLGVLTQLDLYSPSRAKENFYLQLYKTHLQLTCDRQQQSKNRQPDPMGRTPRGQAAHQSRRSRRSRRPHLSNRSSGGAEQPTA